MNDLIRSAIAAEAEERVNSRTVLAELHKRKARKPFGLIVGVATLTVAAAAAAFIIPTAIKKTDAAPATSPAAPVSAANVLLLGMDEVGNTDALVYAHFNADSSVSVVSLPRNVKVGDDQLYSLYAQDPKKLTAAVETLTGTKVDHYAAIKMSEFGRIAQIVGGVEVCLTAPAKEEYSGVDLPAGKSTISGDQALAFLRQRHDLPNGDVDRTRRHQAFLTGLAAKITKDNALPFAREISKTIKVDAGWDVVEFAQRFQGPVKIQAATLPTEATILNNGPAYLAVNPGVAKAFVENQFAGNGAVQDACVN
ncbi:LCP family protein [Lentzea aerocolonigenes]|uniref:LCP family protein n=1 Tax=Lentzea aerocolonigenes TaxID=68170 RepID=UPI0006974193|nr:LCP family protein [Lentzea aerocolonigenes]